MNALFGHFSSQVLCLAALQPMVTRGGMSLKGLVTAVSPYKLRYVGQAS